MAYHLATTNSYVQYPPNNAAYSSSQFTVLMWLYPTASFNVRRIFQYNTTIVRGYRITSSGGLTSNAPFDLRVGISRSVTDVEYITRGMPIQLNKWNYCAVTFDAFAPTGTLVRFYVGYENSPATIQPSGGLSGPVTGDGTGTVLPDPFGPITFGNAASGGGGTFPGYIASLHYLTSVLTEQQIRQQQFNPSPLPTTVIMSDFRTINSGSDLGGHNIYGAPNFVNLVAHSPPTTPL